MFGEYGISIGLALCVILALAVGSTFTPVIPRGEGPVPQAELAEIAAQEFSYCSTNLEGVDCACFAGRAGQVMTHERLEIRGAERIDPAELARLQATESC